MRRKSAAWKYIEDVLNERFGKKVRWCEYQFAGSNPDTLYALAIRTDDEEQKLVASVCFEGYAADILL